MTLHLLFVILSIVCFLLAAVGMPVPRVSLGWLGMFFFALATFIKV